MPSALVVAPISFSRPLRSRSGFRPKSRLIESAQRSGRGPATVSGFNEATKFLYERRESRLKKCASTKKAPQKL
jgi:hypothetical protein